ncbi:MAG: prolipoprotein diacylglyceryl transferase [Myxococcales bacterium]|nr:prolipoprotein diacylglyceryl transferase [Myxococcales bacterium]
MNVHPVLIDFFGFFQLHTYGLMIALGFLIGMQLAVREARRVDLSEKRDFDQFILDLTFWILVAAMLGARALFIIVEWDERYARDPLKIFKIWEGGLVFYGGFIGAVLFSVVYCWRKQRNFFLVADVLIPSVALGHFFGRIGCLAAGCCWGIAASPDFPLAVQFPDGSLVHSSLENQGLIPAGAPFTPHLHPVQLYEAAGELAIFFILLYVRAVKRFHGQALLAYLFLYSLLRSVLESLRGDKARGEYEWFGLTISTSQIISLFVALAALVLLVVLVRRRAQSSRTPSPA